MTTYAVIGEPFAVAGAFQRTTAMPARPSALTALGSVGTPIVTGLVRSESRPIALSVTTAILNR